MKFDPQALWDNPPTLSPAVGAALKRIGEGAAKCLEAERKVNFMGRFGAGIRKRVKTSNRQQPIL